MRLLLQGEDDSITNLPDQYLLFTGSGVFSILSYLAAGYNALDAYLIGAGGGGGGGGGVLTTGKNGGGGGGGGGGGALRELLGLSLSALPANLPVVVGAGGAAGSAASAAAGGNGGVGGNSSFNGLTAYGGGPGEGGKKGVLSPGINYGGYGATGGAYDEQGHLGSTGAGHGAGVGGNRGVSNHTYYPNMGTQGGYGYTYTGALTDIGGSGGGGGGGGSVNPATGNPNGNSPGTGGAGGRGWAGNITYNGLNQKGNGGPAIPGYFRTSGGVTFDIGGGGGGGYGGGVDLTALTSRPGLANIGQGGSGGAGFCFDDHFAGDPIKTTNVNAQPGIAGAVLVRVYLA